MSYKTRAYRKIEDGFEPISRNYICSLKEADQRIFREANKPFYLEPSDEGPQLTYNIKNRTFSFYPRYDGKYYGTSEESETHKYCIEEIANSNELIIKSSSTFPNRQKGDIIKFSFNYVFSEIILQVGDNYIKPDLLIYFREPYDLALRWNRILAIEIVVSHDLNGEKIELMQGAKIPILRIKANKKWGRKKEDEMSTTEKQELKNWIKNTFKKGYSGDLLLDTKSKAFLENKTIESLHEDNIESQLRLSKLKKKAVEVNQEYEKVKYEKENLQLEKAKYLEKCNKLNKKLETAKNQNIDLSQKKKISIKILFYVTLTLLSISVIEALILYFKFK